MNATVLAKATRVFTKEHKHLGVTQPARPTEFLVSIVKGKSIEVFKELKGGTIELGGKFVIGDVAEHDSYNLRYLGLIEQISDKNVTIWPNGHRAPRTAVNGKKKVVRLDLYGFCLRNFKFNLEEVQKENAEASMNI
jgi:hypothetical protein